MIKNRILIFFWLLLLCGGFLSTSLFAKNSSPYYKAEENVYFLMGDFVNEWGYTSFNPKDEKWQKEKSSLPPLLSKDEIETLLEIQRKGSAISPPSNKENKMICVEYAAFDGNVYVFYGISSKTSNTETLIIFTNKEDDKIFAITHAIGSPYDYTIGFSLPEKYQKKWFQLISTLKKRFEEYQKKK